MSGNGESNSPACRVQPLAPATVHITHFAGATPPADRTWLPAVLAPDPAAEIGGIDLVATMVDGCVHLHTGDGDLVLAEARPPMLGVKRTQRCLAVDVPRMEVKYTHTRSDDGIALAFAIAPGEAFYGWRRWKISICWATDCWSHQ